MKLSGEQIEQFEDALSGIKKGVGALTTRMGKIDGGADGAFLERIEKLESEVKKTQRLLVAGRGSAGGDRPRGGVSDACARELAAAFVINLARSGKLEACFAGAATRDAWLHEAREVLGVTARDALTTTEIPLPSKYGRELRELIAEFGVARKQMFYLPLSGGTDRPPRMGTRPQFQSIAMSAAFPQLKPGFSFATLTPHKIGGIVLAPRELHEQSIVDMGKFLAMYGAVEFARAEDLWAFLADGTSTYEEVVGICKACTDLGKIVTLGATKTAPSDASLADFREMRRKVSTAVLGFNGAYYLNKTWEMRLRDFNTQADPHVFVILPDGSARLDGYPIVWTEVLQAYDTAAQVSKYISAFGNLKFWWFGEHGAPRVDQSEHVFFVNDQIATRFIEEIDFDYSAEDAMSVLRTAAA